MATAAQMPFAPDHVPPELRWDHSLAEFNSELDDPFLAAARLYNGPPVFWARDAVQGRPGWVIARHALLQEAFVDWEHFSSEGGMDLTQLLGVDWNLNPVNIDPPRHTAYRKLLTPFFTPKAINHMEAAVRETCDRLIGAFEDRGACEFVGEFSMPFPTYIFLALMGMPIAMAPQFFGWEQSLLHGATMEERMAAGRAILAYLQSHLEAQRKQPTTPLTESIVNAEIDGRPLNDGEILGMFYTFYLGGLDTVYATLGWSMRYIATRPDFQRLLRGDPDRLPKAVDELLRLFSVVSTQRRVARDFAFHGVEMKENDLVVMPIFIACRDPQAYPNPHEADLERKTPLLAFASGPHLCLGMHLARRELRIAIESFLTQFGDIHIPEGESCAWHAGPTFNVDRLPLGWTKIA
jgi:cytochrome P450